MPEDPFKVDATFTFARLMCHECGVRYAVEAYFAKVRGEQKREIYCPNGHSNFYTTPRDGAAEPALIETRRKIALAIHEEDQRLAKEGEAKAAKPYRRTKRASR